VEDLIGIIILVIGAIGGLVVGGLATIRLVDLMACSVSWLGGTPILGWGLLGVIAGGFYGLIKWLKAGSRTTELRRAFIGGGLLIAVLAIAGLASDAGRVLIGR